VGAVSGYKWLYRYAYLCAAMVAVHLCLLHFATCCNLLSDASAHVHKAGRILDTVGAVAGHKQKVMQYSLSTKVLSWSAYG
jgi:hypothetical protein